MNILKNSQTAALKMVSALQAVVNDQNGMTEETYRKVLGALTAAGVDPFPPPVFQAVKKVSHYKDGKDWWCFNEREKVYLCDMEGEFSRFETEEQAQAAIEENAVIARELDAMFSAVEPHTEETVIMIPRAVLTGVANEEPSLSEEFGTCTFCGSADHTRYPSPNNNFYQHQANCAWVTARKIICDSAGLTAGVDGRLSPEEFRNYLRHRGFSLVSKTVRDLDQAMLFAYLPTEVIDENQWVDTAVGLEQYFVCIDDQTLPLTFAQSWCDARLSGRANIAVIPAP